MTLTDVVEALADSAEQPVDDQQPLTAEELALVEVLARQIPQLQG